MMTKRDLAGRPHARSIERPRQKYSTRLDDIRLDMNECVPTMPDALFQKIIAGFSAEMASAYPEVNRAYEALADYLSMPRDRVLLASGADMAIKMSLEAFCGPGDVIATVAPTFAMYKIHAMLLDCRFNEVLCDQTGGCSLRTLLSLAKPGVKAIIVANPNGVTGHVFPLESVRKLATRAESQGTLLVIDETYADFAGIDAAPLLDEFANVVIVRSFSKNVGMAGLRIGYVLAPEGLASVIERFKPMIEISSLAARAVEVICSDRRYTLENVQRVLVARTRFATAMRRLGFDCIVRGGNFVLVNFGDQRSAICALFETNRIRYKHLPVPLSGYQRITIATEAVMDRVAEMIGKWIL